MFGQLGFVKTLARIAVLLFFPGSVFALSSPITPLRSAAEVDYPPFSIVREDGRADGFSVELLREALARMGREVSFRIGPWAEVKGWLESGDVEVLPLAGRTPEREAVFDFTVPYMTMHGALVVRRENGDIQTIDDLRGRRVGVMAGDNTEEFLRREDRGIEIVTTPTFADAFRELSEGRCDAVLVQRLVALRLLEETGLTNTLLIVDRPVEGLAQEFCFAVKEGDRETLALLNEGLAIVVADGTHRRLHAKWFAPLQLPSDRPLIIGGDHNYPPFEFLDENGRPAGFNVELTRAIAKEMGLEIQIRLGPWAEVVEQLRFGEIDAVQGMFYSNERDQFADFSPPFFVSHYVSVVRRDFGKAPETIDELTGLDVIVQENDYVHEYLRAKGLGDRLTLTENQENALREVAEGRRDCALAVRVVALNLIEENGWDNLVTSRRPFLTREYGYAVPKGRSAVLAEFSEGLAAVKASGEFNRLQDKWLGVYEKRDFGWRDAVRYVIWIAGPLLLVALLALLWTRELRKTVARRTAELRDSEARFRVAQELSLDGFTILHPFRDEQGMIVDFTWVYENQTVARLNGTDPDTIKGKRLLELFPTHRETSIFEAYLDVANTGTSRVLEEVNTGEILSRPVWLRLVIVSMGEEIAILSQDISERKRIEAEHEKLQSQFLQAQKLESVGRLAGGVAHDFNNMLTGIMGYAELCRGVIDAGHPAREWLDGILHESERSANLARQLLTFARKQVITPKILDLNDTVENMLKMLRRLIGEDIELIWQPGAKLEAVKIDPGQVDQILANLCVNARDAIGGRAGKVVIRTENISIDKATCAKHVEAAPGDYVRLEVSDTGCGMDQETLANIFEPFFTTKEVGEGTGLGLATVYGIIKQNGGFVDVYSELGKGSTFRIHLPRVAAKAAESQPKPQADTPPGGAETILLVEDEKAIRFTLTLCLKHLGYTVIEAESPDAALELTRDQGDGIDLLLTDVVMPGMNGRELAESLKAAHPGMKVLYMSGYTADIIAHQGLIEENVNFLSKPVTRDALARKVREVLDGDDV